MRKLKRLPVGVEDFAKIRNEDFYYVDKTGWIKELLDNWAEVNLFTRPRRFGKSLNMNMLSHCKGGGALPGVYGKIPGDFHYLKGRGCQKV